MIINISSITVRDVDAIQGEWEIHTLSLSLHKNYDVYVLIDENKNVYLKPIKCYYESEFERIFNFGIMCKDFDINKTVLVVKPTNFYTNFIRS